MTTTPRLSRALFALASVPLLVIGLAACSPGGDESAPDVKSEAQLADDATAWDVANATCLRGEGIDIDDPSADGTTQGTLKSEDDMAAVSKASEKCQEATTDDLGPRPVTAADEKATEEQEAQFQETAECLRAKGYDVADTGGSASDIPADAVEECGGATGDNSTVRKR